MSSPRPHLRLVDGSRRGGDRDEPPVDPAERPAHDLHAASREPDDPLDDGEVVDAGFPRPAERRGDAFADDAPYSAPQPRFVVAALVAFQALAALGYAGKYLQLVRGGGVDALAAWLAAPASLCLYAGAALLLLRPGTGRALFAVAAVGFGLSVPAWGIQYGWTWPMAFGSMLGLAGAWCARPEIRPPTHEEAQP